MLPPPAPDGQPQVVQQANSGSEPLGRKHTSSFSIFKVDKRDCSCWHLCTSSLWTGCWAQSWEACQKKQHRSGRGHRSLEDSRVLTIAHETTHCIVSQLLEGLQFLHTNKTQRQCVWISRPVYERNREGYLFGKTVFLSLELIGRRMVSRGRSSRVCSSGAF